jgi:hypothetical protein
MGQLPREMRDALGANARTKVVFTCSPEDAYGLARHFSPELSEHDLSHLSTYQAACRPTIAGGLGHAFTFRTLPLGPESTGRASAVRERSAELFAADRRAVEGEIRNRHLRIEQLLPRETSAPLAEEPGRQSVGQSIGRSVGQSVGQS